MHANAYATIRKLQIRMNPEIEPMPTTDNQDVRKAVIAAAGFGTRFLPYTKAMPKEMLPLVDKPIIQHIVEELVDAGIEDIIIVSGDHKSAIDDHFRDTSRELADNLKQGGKTEILEHIDDIGKMANFVFINQRGPQGNGTPVLNAEHLLDPREPFIYTFADDFVEASPSRFKQLIDVRKNLGGSVLTCVTRDAPDDYKKYGYVSGEEIEPGILDTEKVVEKPGTKEESPSSLATVSGYVFDPIIFEYLKEQLKDHDATKGEFKIQDSMQAMIDDGHHIYSREIQGGTFYDTGDKLEYLKTVVDFALEREDIGQKFKDYLLGRLQ